MHITYLELTNFRCYSKIKFEFSPGTSIIIGPNGSGKTNLLEAVFLLAVGKSFRAERDTEMIAFEEEIGRVKGEIKKLSNLEIEELEDDRKDTDEKIELEEVLTRGEVMGVKTPIKRYLINGVGKRGIDFAGRLKVVLFWPQDLELVTDSPSLRRRYLDSVLSQVDREYRRCLLSYERGLRQRNRVLEVIREKGAHRHQLLFWDQLLIKNGEYITRKREECIEYINKCQIKSKLQISNYKLEYDKSVISKQRLDQYQEQEIASGMTLVGPHRDDFIFQITNNKEQITKSELKDLSSFGSRGEQRLAVLWLKLGELSYIEEVTGDKPVLLLDDILSELDHEHRKIVFGIVGQQQTVITTTDIHFIERSRIKEAEIIELS